jgi:hypothetical protein
MYIWGIGPLYKLMYCNRWKCCHDGTTVDVGLAWVEDCVTNLIP